jgi:hypothetical protein
MRRRALDRSPRCPSRRTWTRCCSAAAAATALAARSARPGAPAFCSSRTSRRRRRCSRAWPRSTPASWCGYAWGHLLGHSQRWNLCFLIACALSATKDSVHYAMTPRRHARSPGRGDDLSKRRERLRVQRRPTAHGQGPALCGLQPRAGLQGRASSAESRGTMQTLRERGRRLGR